MADQADPKARLLAAAIDHVAQHGLGDLSLRQLATAIGTSHRMLIYYFGSKEGLLVEVVRAVEQQQRDALAQLDLDPDLTDVEVMRQMWKRFTDPAVWPHERLFFEMYGQALQGRGHSTQLLNDIVDAWVKPASERLRSEHGMTAAGARAEARLQVAVIRGLLLDLLATGDRRSVDRAFELFIERYESPRRRVSAARPRSRSAR